jgi:hypothetical protein
MQLLIRKFSPLFPQFLPLISNYSQQQNAVNKLDSIFFDKEKDYVLTPI